MVGVSSVIEHVLTDRLLRSAPPSGRQAFGQAVFAMSVFFVCLGAGFLIYGTHMWLTRNYAPETAAAITGGVSLGFAVLVGACAYGVLMYRQSRIKQYRREIADKIESATAVLDDQFGDTIRDNPKMAILLASLAGFFIEERLQP